MDQERTSKQIIVVRKDLNMRKGKIGAQAAHASLAAYKTFLKKFTVLLRIKLFFHKLLGWFHIDESIMAFLDWDKGSFTKITVSVNSEQDLFDVYYKAHHAGLVAVMITDEGRTEFHGDKTRTAIAIGPAWSDALQPITGNLSLI